MDRQPRGPAGGRSGHPQSCLGDFSPARHRSPTAPAVAAYGRAMFGSGRPDGAAARARLHAIAPRWVPTEADLAAAANGQDASFVGAPAAVEPGIARHALPEPQRAAWRLDAGAVRGLVSLALAALVGALVVVIAGWPRGAAAPSADAGRVRRLHR